MRNDKPLAEELRNEPLPPFIRKQEQNPGKRNGPQGSKQTECDNPQQEHVRPSLDFHMMEFGRIGFLSVSQNQCQSGFR